jgi:hypothetical protein
MPAVCHRAVGKGKTRTQAAGASFFQGRRIWRNERKKIEEIRQNDGAEIEEPPRQEREDEEKARTRRSTGKLQGQEVNLVAGSNKEIGLSSTEIVQVLRICYSVGRCGFPLGDKAKDDHFLFRGRRLGIEFPVLYHIGILGPIASWQPHLQMPSGFLRVPPAPHLISAKSAIPTLKRPWRR